MGGKFISVSFAVVGAVVVVVVAATSQTLSQPQSRRLVPCALKEKTNITSHREKFQI